MFNPVLPRTRRIISRASPGTPLSTPQNPPQMESPGLSSVGLIEKSPVLDEPMDQSHEYSSAPTTPTPKATKFPSGQFTTNLPMPSLNSNIELSPPIKRNKRKTFDERVEESQEAINRAQSIGLLKTAKTALLKSFVLDKNPETAIVIDNVNSLLTKKSINIKTTLDMMNWKLDKVIDQTSNRTSETTRKSTRVQQVNMTENPNKVVNTNARKETAGVTSTKVNNTPPSWSQMLGKATANSENWTTVSRSKNSSQTSNKLDKTDELNTIKLRRLIITPKIQIGDIDSLKLRDQINAQFSNAKLDIVINTVEKSKTGQNIVLTTSSKNTAAELLENKSIWEHMFDAQRIRKDESWFKVIAHGVNIATFDQNMQFLQNEIQKFNLNMELCDLPRWLARDRENKVNSSVVLTFNDRNQALNALKGVNIAGKHCDTEIFTSVRPNTQCINCQKFGHKHYQCRNKSKCNICAQNHETRNHECITCKSKTAYAHVVVKCANCNKNHQSNDEHCEMFTALNPRKSADELSAL